jgi:hypothetical protein
MASRTSLGIFRRLLDLHRDRRGNVTVIVNNGNHKGNITCRNVMADTSRG